jgi:hypothetical protein
LIHDDSRQKKQRRLKIEKEMMRFNIVTIKTRNFKLEMMRAIIRENKFRIDKKGKIVYTMYKHFSVL